VRKEGDTEMVGCIKYGMGDMMQLMDTEAAGGKNCVEVCDIGKPPVGDWAPNKRVIETNESSQFRKETKIDFVEYNKVTHVERNITTPHVTTQLTEPKSSNPVLIITNYQFEGSTGEEMAEHQKMTTKWKRRARVCQSSSTQKGERDRGKKRNASSEDGNATRGKRGRKENTEMGGAITGDQIGSGMAVATWRPRQPQ
jgi:hypothetical protein